MQVKLEGIVFGKKDSEEVSRDFFLIVLSKFGSTSANIILLLSELVM